TGAAIGGAAAAGGAAAGGGAAAAATGAAAAIGTKAAAGLATAAIIAGGAAEIQNVADHHPASKPQAKERSAPQKAPPANPLTQAAQAPPTTATPPTTPPAAATTPPPNTVTVEPQPADPAATDPTTGATAPTVTGKATTGRHKRHKGALANSESQTKTGAQSGPVTTGVEPATCDADGDGVTDPGAPSSCTSGSAVTTGVDQGNTVAPVPYSAPAPKKKAVAKKKLRRRQARSR
ncbi:MAG: hypothetical protein ACJ75Z_05555, partial [Solirubrobacterales bacterium]